jgi:FixJ family two-component response regulator
MRDGEPSVRRTMLASEVGGAERARSVAGRIVISIVDDDEAVREAMARLMKAHGYLVQTFDSGASLLNSERRADCLIADVAMPGMTGLELHDRLVAAGESIPTILITAHPDETARSRALRAGVLCYLAKPFSEDELLGCVRSAVEGVEEKGSRR